MKSFVKFSAFALALSAVAPAHAGPEHGDHASKLRAMKWLKAAYARHALGVSAEKMSCTGPGGTIVSYQTTTREARTLSGPVTVKLANKTTVVPALLMNTFLNEDDRVVMEGRGLASGVSVFKLALELVATTEPNLNEVATYAGTVSVGSNEGEITCSATRNGAGLLKPQLGTRPIGSPNISVLCMREGELPNTTALPLVQFELGRTASKRLYSDLNEVREPTDSEVLPSFLVSQYSFAKAAFEIQVDDSSPQGNLLARLKGAGIRVPTNQPAADPAIYGAWAGTYQRFDAGREINEAVACYAF